MSFANTVETLALAGAFALTSYGIGLTVDSMFPPDVPADDLMLIAHIAAQFGVSTAVATELFRAVLSARPDDAPPSLGDGVPFYFLYSSQKNLGSKFDALGLRMRSRLLQVLASKQQVAAVSDDNNAQVPEGGNPVAPV
jgi:hypothetical protein